MSAAEILNRLPLESTEQHSKFVYDYFAEQTLSKPQAIALEMREQKISYQQLQHWVNDLASALSEFGYANEETVAILSPERANIEFVVSILALWKLGLAYVPLNSQHPAERLNYVLDTVGCKKILVIDDFKTNLDFLKPDAQLLLEVRVKAPELFVRVLNETVPLMEAASNSLQEGPSPLAYILFTSGCTGLPKGVLILSSFNPPSAAGY